MSDQPSIVLIAGSPSANSRSARLLGELQKRLETHQLATSSYSLSDFDARELLFGNAAEPKLAAFIASVREASAVVFATPVYKATYTGGLKLLIDVIPPDALAGKAALAVATGRLESHFQSVARAFDDLYRFFGIGTPVPLLALLDGKLKTDGPELGLEPDAEEAVRAAVAALRTAVTEKGRPAAALPLG